MKSTFTSYGASFGVLVAMASAFLIAAPSTVDGKAGSAAAGGGDSNPSAVLDPDFVIAEFDGKKVTNRDLGPELLQHLNDVKSQVIDIQLRMARRHITEKYDVNPYDDKIKYSISEPRVNIPILDSDPARGDEKSPVTIVEFSDYKCGYCGYVNPILQQIYDDYKGKVRHVFKNFAFLSPESPLVAQAGQCVWQLNNDSFWSFQKQLFANRKNQSPQAMAGYAATANVDPGAFANCLNSDKNKGVVEKNLDIGRQLGIRGTPAVFINGLFIRGARDYAGYKEIIENELKKAGS